MSAPSYILWLASCRVNRSRKSELELTQTLQVEIGLCVLFVNHRLTQCPHIDGLCSSASLVCRKSRAYKYAATLNRLWNRKCTNWKGGVNASTQNRCN